MLHLSNDTLTFLYPTDPKAAAALHDWLELQQHKEDFERIFCIWMPDTDTFQVSAVWK